MPRIRQLESVVVDKIAAGEVIERPASVVKELLENSVDALATRIEVDVADGGTELIRVVDNGEGMHADDMTLAATSHATSKISSDDDLFHIHTLGFRGEALASVAAVSRMEIRTRRADDDSGAMLTAQGGQIGSVVGCGCPNGTRIDVRSLFFNTPVRRRFLRTTSTEFGHISEQFVRIALAHPRLHLVLRHNERVVHELPATDSLLNRLRLFHGSDMADQLISVESDADAGDGDTVRLWGFVGHPDENRSSRKAQYLFLNGRWIQDRSLQHALTEAYRGLQMTGRYPIAFLFLEMPSHLVDVNVHPTKAEVRFRDGQQLYRQLLSTIRNRFLTTDLHGRMTVPAPALSSVAAEVPLQQLELSAPPAVAPVNGQPGTSAPPSLDRRFNPDAVPQVNVHPSHPSQALPAVEPGSGAGRTRVDVGSPERHANTTFNDRNSTHLQQSHRESVAADSPGQPGDAEDNNGVSSGSSPPPEEFRAIQIHDCYIALANRDGLTVIDQHALHERILYEYLRNRVLDGQVESQRLLVPKSLELSPREAAAILEHRDLLRELGFEIEDFGGNTVLVTALPVMLPAGDVEQILHDIAGEFERPEQKPTRRDILDSLLRMMSCRAAIKSGHRLSQEEMQSLLEQRHLIDDSHHCPHGRPTSLVLSRGTLDRQFGRLG